MAENPTDAHALRRRADLRRESGDFDAALADLERAERLEPDAPTTAVLRARVELDLGQAAAALVTLRPQVAAPGSPALVHRLQAEAMLRLDRPALAAAALSRAIDAQPAAPPSLYLERARAHFSAAEAAEESADKTAGAAAAASHHEAAIAGLDEGIARLGPVAGLVREAIRMEVARRRFEQALARLTKATAAAERKETWLEWRGRVLDQAGRHEQAREAYEQARRALARVPDARRSSRAMRALDDRLTLALGPRSGTGPDAVADAAGDRD